MIKIFSSDKRIWLIADYKLFEPQPGSIMLSVSSAAETGQLYTQLINSKEIDQVFFCYKDENVLFDWFKSLFTIVEAAGGLVKNADNKYLFIFRNGKWDLPKGKIEKGEGKKTAAIREVEEECGITGLSIIKTLNPTYHTYLINEKSVLKPTYWYEMSCSGNPALIPQTEEGITEVRWIARKDWDQVRENTYDSILDVIESVEKS